MFEMSITHLIGNVKFSVGHTYTYIYASGVQKRGPNWRYKFKNQQLL